MDAITTNDICAGRLKAVLALFFALSRYKQAAKQKTGITTTATAQSGKQQLGQQHYQQAYQPSSVNAANEMTNR